MFLHIGSQMVLSKDSIIAILNMRTIGISGITKEFLNKREKNIRRVGKKVPKSLIITSKRDIFLSPIQTQTLKRRFEKRSF